MPYEIEDTAENISQRIMNSPRDADLSGLSTTDKTLIGAINELFTSASNGRSALAAAITGRGVNTAASDTLATMATNISSLPAALVQSITYTGTYATATYYTAAGCGIFYCPDGRVGLVIQGGTSTSYENIQFTLTDNTGLGIMLAGQSVNNYASATAQNYYVAILSGITEKITLTCNFSAINATYDYVTCAVTAALAE